MTGGSGVSDFRGAKKSRPRAAFLRRAKNYFLAASTAAPTAAPAEAPAAPAAEAASLAASTAVEAAPTAAEAAPVAAATAASAEGAAGASAGAGTTTTGAGAGAGASSFLPQAASATAATIAANTRDLFIFTILDDIEENNFRKLSKETEPEFSLFYDQGKGLELFPPSFKLYAGYFNHENP